MNPIRRDAALLRVMADPQAYAHPLRQVPSGPDGNDWFIAAMGLQRDCGPLQAQAWRWVEGWDLLPTAAVLLGCCVERAAAAHGAGRLQLTRWQRRFALRDLAALAPPSLACGDTPLRSGWRQLLALARCQLPRPLRQRLRLQFPPEVDALGPASHRVDALVFAWALHDAQNHRDRAAG